jgi:hypothetical protein
METPPAAPAAAPAGGGQQQQQGGGGSWTSMIMRGLIMYMVIQYLMGPKSTKPTVDSTGKALPPHRNAWTPGQPMDLYVYLSENAEYFPSGADAQRLVWNAKGLRYNWDSSNTIEKLETFIPSESVKNNATVFAHIFFVKAGKKPVNNTETIYAVHPLVRYLPKPKATGRKNLLSGEKDDLKAPEGALSAHNITEYIPFWKPNLTLHLVDDHTSYPNGGIPHQIVNQMRIDEEQRYLPVLYIDEFWLMREHLQAINETTTNLTVLMTYNPIAMWKWQIQVQMEQSLAMQENFGGTQGEGEEFKRMLTDTNPYLLGLTFVISILHSIFDFLAFKNDIAFWKNNKSMEGLSVKTIMLNCACQLIIFLYLLDNDTSWLILISSGVGLLIELWKIQKAMIVSLEWNGSIPRIKLEDKQSYISRTKEYDDIAMKKMSYALYVIVIGYAIYALVYETHKSWYSWILGSLVGAVYTFGFILMLPQLFINYKLKSVAHLPWKTFMYKALNTFIDDLFAFIIKMPTLHRLSCLRDDLIFLIYLYQRWIYPVDIKRTNEFGQSFVPDPNTGEPPTTPGEAAAITSTTEATTATTTPAESKKTK